MNKAKILELAEQLFLRNPFDNPETIFRLVGEWMEYVEKWDTKLENIETTTLYSGSLICKSSGLDLGSITLSEPNYPLDKLIDDTTS